MKWGRVVQVTPPALENPLTLTEGDSEWKLPQPPP
jgi:hypothetical protein